MRALAPEVRIYRFRAPRRSETAGKAVPHRLKPSTVQADYGTPEPVPFVQGVFPQPKGRTLQAYLPSQMSTC
jgi:hypothetical protein